MAKPAGKTGVNAARVKPGTLEDSVGVRIGRLAEVFARLAKLNLDRPWGLRNTDLRILNSLDGTDSMLISEIARRTRVDKAWISRSVLQLVDKGLVERRIDPEDSRVSLAALTASGRDLLDRIRPFVILSETRLLTGIEARTFKRDLDRLLSNAEGVLADSEERDRACRAQRRARSRS